MEDDTVTVEAMQMCAEYHRQETHPKLIWPFSAILRAYCYSVTTKFYRNTVIRYFYSGC